VSETQETIGRWARATFPGGDDQSPRHCLRLLEEVVELCRAAGASKRKILDTITLALRDDLVFRKLDPPEKIAEEMADVAIVLAVIAHRRGVDLQAEVDEKMRVNRSRTWKSHGDGTGYHVKEG
jgi:NTP pyrophosphatase (non-canonical NTP hydrolase)